MHVKFIEIINVNIKNYYSIFIFKISVRMNSRKKYTVLLNIEIKINVMIEKMIINEKYLIKLKFQLNLIDYTKHFNFFFKNL